MRPLTGMRTSSRAELARLPSSSDSRAEVKPKRLPKRTILVAAAPDSRSRLGEGSVPPH